VEKPGRSVFPASRWASTTAGDGRLPKPGRHMWSRLRKLRRSPPPARVERWGGVGWVGGGGGVCGGGVGGGGGGGWGGAL